jgi:hypothetical protein
MRKLLIVSAGGALALAGAVSANAAANPAAPAPTTSTASVPANGEGGANTGVNVNSQKTVTVTVDAGSTINYGGGNLVGPQGDTVNYPDCPLLDGRHCTADGVGVAVGQLIYKVGENGVWGPLPAGGVITSKTGGLVFLGVNDAVGTYGDNEGSFQVTLVRAPVA